MTEPTQRRIRRGFIEQYEREVVARYRSTGVSAARSNEELGVSESILYRWVGEFLDAKTPSDSPSY